MYRQAELAQLASEIKELESKDQLEALRLRVALERIYQLEIMGLRMGDLAWAVSKLGKEDDLSE